MRGRKEMSVSRRRNRRRGAGLALALLAALGLGACGPRQNPEAAKQRSIDELLSIDVPERFPEEPVVVSENGVVTGYQYRTGSGESAEEYFGYRCEPAAAEDAPETISAEEYESIHADDELLATGETDGTKWFISLEDATIRYEDEEEAALVEQNGFTPDQNGYFQIPGMSAVARCLRDGYEIEVILENSYDSLTEEQGEELVEIIRRARFPES